MATLITKNSQTAGSVPSAGSLQVGELAVNTADGKLFTKHSDNTVKALSPTLNELLPSQTGNGGRVLGTNGSTTSWVSPSATTLLDPMPLASGTSVTQGRAVSINASGEIGQYPVLNTFSSEFSNPTAARTYAGYSTTGDRAVVVDIVSQSPYTTSGALATTTFTIRGVAISDTGAAVNGTNTYTSTVNAPSGSFQQGSSGFVFYLAGVSSNRIGIGMFFQANSAAGYNDNNVFVMRAIVLEVDSSGNVSLVGSVSERTDNRTNAGTIYGVDRSASFNNSGIAVLRTNYNMSLFTRHLFTFSSTGTAAYSEGSEIDTLHNTGGVRNSLITTNNIFCAFSGNTGYFAPYTTGNIGTVTTSTVISDANLNQVSWFVIDNTKVLAYFLNSSLLPVLRTYSVNQTTGALTQVSERSLSFSNVESIAFKNTTEGVLIYNSGGVRYVTSFLLDSNGSILGFNIPLIVSTVAVSPQYNSNNKFFLQYFVANQQKMRSYSVNAYSTNLFSYAGIAQSTTSTSPATIQIGGLASGFSGLTPNTNYYVSNAYDGTITTSAATGILVGKAVSTTEILMGYTT